MQYEIQDGDTIDVHMEQIGGSFPVTEDVDQEWVLVNTEDDEASAKRLQEENKELKGRLEALERSATASAVKTVHTLDSTRRGGKIALEFCDHRNAKVTFKLSNTTRLRKAFEAYAGRVCVPAERIFFRWKEFMIQGEDTPFEVSLTNQFACTSQHLILVLARHETQ